MIRAALEELDREASEMNRTRWWRGRVVTDMEAAAQGWRPGGIERADEPLEVVEPLPVAIVVPRGRRGWVRR